MDIESLLGQSAATDAFKADVRAYLTQTPSTLITTARPSPRVKVLRVISQLLHAEPALPIERVYVDALSGCSDFQGTITVTATGEHRAFGFTWCCHWRAQEEGWFDCFGFPDQIRAAREFGWQCFARWEPAVPSASLPRAAAHQRAAVS